MKKKGKGRKGGKKKGLLQHAIHFSSYILKCKKLGIIDRVKGTRYFRT